MLQIFVCSITRQSCKGWGILCHWFSSQCEKSNWHVAVIEKYIIYIYYIYIYIFLKRKNSIMVNKMYKWWMNEWEKEKYFLHWLIAVASLLVQQMQFEVKVSIPRKIEWQKIMQKSY